jgi:acetyl esterase
MVGTPDTGTRAVPGLARRAVGRVVWASLRASLLVSPRPVALLIRRQFASSVVTRTAELDALATPGVRVVSDEHYGPNPAARLDLFVPPSPNDGRLPLVAWIHGGAFVGGTKEELRGWFRQLAAMGVPVAAIEYPLAPEARHPVPARQVQAALRYLQDEAGRLGIDASRVVLAGDSAGAQLAAQAAVVTVDPRYARAIGVEPSLRPEQLSGAVLCCGIFDLTSVGLTGPFAPFTDAVGWAYSGHRRYRDDEAFMSAMAVTEAVGPSFPPAFVTAGNADPLLPQSMALAERLTNVGAPVETLFYPPDHRPALGHEYQFEPGLPEGRDALARIAAFVVARG